MITESSNIENCTVATELNLSSNKGTIQVSGLDESLMETFLYPSDNISLILKKIKNPSPIKTYLAHSLSKFHKYPLYLILIEILIGFIFIGLPVILIIYINILNNKIMTFLIITIISLIFYISLIIGRIIDDIIHKSFYLVKWQRNNILSNFGLSLNLSILIVPIIFVSNIYGRINQEFEKNDKNINYLNCFIIDIFYYFTRGENNIFTDLGKINNNQDESILFIEQYLFFASIPLLVICFFKIMKGFLIKIKYSIEYIFFYMILFVFCILNIIHYLKEIEIRVISLLQFICMLLLLFIYDIWIIHSYIKKIINQNDKCFGFRKYKPFHLFIILLFDISLFTGTSIILASLILYYINYVNYFNQNQINIEHYIIKFLLRLGFCFGTFGFTYYYGYHLMKMIMKPISFEFIPSELKDENYIRPNLNNNVMELLLMKEGVRRKKQEKNKKYYS